MSSSADLRVLFRIAAGRRRGFAHLVRSLSLARAIGVRPLLCVRGPGDAADAALALGADLLSDGAPRSIPLLRPDVVVVDDPVASAARRWVTAARRAGAIVVTIHDLGIGHPEGDVAIDGSVVRQARPKRAHKGATGTRYTILDPALPTRDRLDTPERRVLVALGGGPRRAMAATIVKAIAAADPRAEIRIAGAELSHVSVAVVGGGVSVYEACAVGAPREVRSFARPEAAVRRPFTAGRGTAARVVALFDDPQRRARLRRRSMRLVAGGEATRAAAAVLSFVERKRL
jgi:spore coat polysaccharide biosynthesis predicted glycosyltransferase SpsG